MVTEAPRTKKSSGRETLVLPFEGGSAAGDSLGVAAAPIAGGGIAVLVGLFVMVVLSRKADPDERHGILLFGAIFVLFGAIFIRVGVSSAAGVLSARRRRRREADPWRQDHAWDTRQGAAGQYVRIGPQLFGLVLYTAFLLPFNTIWTSSFTLARIVVGVLDLVWLLVAWETVRRILQRLRVGRVTLNWSSFPTYVGQRFDATFTSSRPLAATGPIQVTLRCISQEWVGGGSKQSPTKESFVLYKATIAVPAPAGSSIPIAFEVPPDAKGTSLARVEPVFWQLEIRAPTPGPDFLATFLVPIYDPAYRPEAAPAHVRALAEHRADARAALGAHGESTVVQARGAPIFGAVLFGLIGVGMLAAAWSLGRDGIAFARTSSEVEGVVVRNDSRYSTSSSNSAPSRMYVAIVRYEVDGHAYEIEQSIGSGSPTYAEQERVTVIYPPQRPGEGRIKSLLELYFPLFLLGGMGAACVGAALMIFLVFVRR